MTHLVLAPILIPLVAAVACVLSRGGSRSSAQEEQRPLNLQRVVSGAAIVAQVIVAIVLLARVVDDESLVYRVGNWPASFGIVLVIDRLSAAMVTLATVLGLCVYGDAVLGPDRRGPHFHALLHLQIMGLQGAFCTGDLFNLFVFFEVLLLASYGLLVHGTSGPAMRPAFHYVVLNLVGSAAFLVAVAVFYRTLGTVNMADVASRVSTMPDIHRKWVGVGGAILLGVFGLKAAAAPLHLWLAPTYRAAPMPVVALFAIMTKVGVYGIMRVHGFVLGSLGTTANEVFDITLSISGTASVLLGTAGALASNHIREMASFLVIASVGTMLLALAPLSEIGIAATLFYLLQSTLILAGWFLFGSIVGRARGDLGDRLTRGPKFAYIRILGLTFVFGAMNLVGMPPTSGFLGKVLVLEALGGARAVWAWPVVLATSFALLLASARTGSVLFWNVDHESVVQPQHRRDALPLVPMLILFALSAAMVVAAHPLERYVRATARQLGDPAAYVRAVHARDTPPPKGEELTGHGH
jgi:multicomponent K+:H+ antiporter subunit D